MKAEMPLPRYDNDLGVFLEDLRSWLFRSKSGAGRHLNLSHSTISRYENGKITPPPDYIAYLVYEIHRHTQAPDAQQQAHLLREFNVAILLNYTVAEQVRNWDELEFLAKAFIASRTPPPIPPVIELQRTDLTEAPDVTEFYGRQHELDELKQVIVNGEARMVLITGMGGLGKTALAVHLAKGLAGEFEFIIWLSLRDAPQLEFTVYELSKRLIAHVDSKIPQSLDQQISRLTEFMRENRCLVILDNLESLLDAQERSGDYRLSHEAYRSFFATLTTSDHKSCLLLTSRELPLELANELSRPEHVHIYPLAGLPFDATEQLLKKRGILGDDTELTKLNTCYSGNILALKLVAETIRKYFNNAVSQFLAQDGVMFNDIRHVLDHAFTRVTPIAHEIAYWLAVEREPITFDKLHSRMMQYRNALKLVEGLELLERMSLVEQREDKRWYLPNVVSEYVIEHIIQSIHDEVAQDKLHTLHSVALLTTDLPEYIRQTQIRLLVAPIAQMLVNEVGVYKLRAKFERLLAEIRTANYRSFGFAPGNLLNIMAQCNIDMHDYDFSGLMIQHAYLSNVALINVDFSQADIQNCRFDDSFIGINSVALSPQAEYLAVAAGTEIRVWHLSERQPYRVLRRQHELVWNIIFCQDEKHLLSRDMNNTICLWNIETAEIELTIEHRVGINAVAVSPDARLIATGSNDGTIFLWDMASGHLKTELVDGQNLRIHAIVFDASGTQLAVGNAEGYITIWDIPQGKHSEPIHGHTRAITALAYLNGANPLLVSSSSDAMLKYWEFDGDTYTLFKEVAAHDDIISSIRVGRDNRVVSSSYDGHVKIWEIDSDTPQISLPPHALPVSAIDIDEHGSILISGSYDRIVRIWNLSDGHLIDTIIGHTFEFLSLDFSPNGQELAAGSSNYHAFIWDLSSDSRLQIYTGHVRWVSDVRFSPNGQRLATGSYDRTVRLWSAFSRQNIKILRDASHWIMCIEFCQNGQMVAAGGVDRLLRVWDTSNYELLHTLEAHDHTITSLASHAELPLLASGGRDGKICLWDLESGNRLATLPQHTADVKRLAFAADKPMLYCVFADGVVWLWDLDKEELAKVWYLSPDMLQVFTFSADGNYLACYGSARIITLWDVPNERLLRRLPVNGGRVSSLALDKAMCQLASGSVDGQINIWNLETGLRHKILKVDRPYEGLNITDTQGLTATQREMLKSLGAFDHKSSST